MKFIVYIGSEKYLVDADSRYSAQKQAAVEFIKKYKLNCKPTYLINYCTKVSTNLNSLPYMSTEGVLNFLRKVSA